jgi:peroxin-19
MFADMRLGGAAGLASGGAPGGLDEGNLLPMMETMMQSLLSKDLLYPAIRDLADKYPEWLADKRQDLSNDVFDKYNRQFELTKQVTGFCTFVLYKLLPTCYFADLPRV